MLVVTIGRALAQKSRGLARLEHRATSFQKHVSGARTSPLRGFPEVAPAAATLRISGEGGTLFGCRTQNAAAPLADPRARSSISLHRHMLTAPATTDVCFVSPSKQFTKLLLVGTFGSFPLTAIPCRMHSISLRLKG